LAKSVSEIDAVLKRFSLGVPAWVTSASYGGEVPFGYDLEEIGYAKVSGRWGIAIRTRKGDERFEESEVVEQWIFNEAPRYLRVSAADKLPELLEELVTKASKMADSISEKVNDVRVVTTAMYSVLEDMAADQKEALTPGLSAKGKGHSPKITVEDIREIIPQIAPEMCVPRKGK
jgi:transglutaminase-like putative cysteine protease